MGNNEREKIKILLNHWIKHNREHSLEFREWAKKAKELGEIEIYDHILKAAHEMDKVNEYLLQALSKLEKKIG